MNPTNSKSFVGEIEISYKRRNKPSKRIRQSDQAASAIRPLFGEINYKEKACAMFLSRSNDVIGYAKISEGGSFSTVIDTKIVLQHALMSHASGIILFHNHPSNNKKPSQLDISMTKRLKEASNLLELNLLDHIILTENDYTSLADEGLM